MAPFGGVVDVAAEETRDRRSTEEKNVLASIIAAGKTGFARVAGNVGLNGDSVTRLEVLDGGVGGNDLKRRYRVNMLIP